METSLFLGSVPYSDLSKSRKKFLATTYKHFPGALYAYNISGHFCTNK